jgi:hypothetical protein
MEAHTAIEKVLKHTADAQVRVTRRIEIGKAVQQGDIYLHRVAAGHPRGDLLGTRKLAIGEGEGSRHFAEGDGVEVYQGLALPPEMKEPDWVEPGALLGPIVVAPAQLTVTHPVHPHHVLPAGTYQVTDQADDSTRRRVVD